MFDIFLSYNRQGQAVARRHAEALTGVAIPPGHAAIAVAPAAACLVGPDIATVRSLDAAGEPAA